MVSLELRAVIKFLIKKGLNSRQIFDEIETVYGSGTVPLRSVEKWYQEFRAGRESIEDDPRSGRPTSTRTQDNIELVASIVREDGRISIPQISMMTGISYGSVQKILCEDLHYKKLSAKWIPRNLRVEEMQRRVEICRQNLEIYRGQKQAFFNRVITQDETWIYDFEPEIGEATKFWTGPGEKRRKLTKPQKSPNKVMLSVFWDKNGIILADFLEPGQTVTGEVYASEINRLRENIKQMRRGMLTRKPLLLIDNAPAHRSQVAHSAYRDCDFELLEHPPYSPDLAPSDYYLFGRLKADLRGKRFKDKNEIKSFVSGWFDSRPNDFYSKAIESLPEKWNKCIRLRGEYIED